MTVINISLERSAEEIIAGIPKYLELSTNIPATIFYTLDGSEPNFYSSVYIERLYLPLSDINVVFKYFANDGINSTSIITEEYVSNIGSTRTKRPATNAGAGTNYNNLYPFGTNEFYPNSLYLANNKAGITVFDEELSSISNGFNADGYAALSSNEVYDTTNYSIVYTSTNEKNESLPNVGTIPAKVTNLQEPAAAFETNQFTITFDPKAFVIFQDLDKQDPNDPSQINRQFFSLDDDMIKDGNRYFATAMDSPPLTGAFLKSYLNTDTNVIKYYFFDSWSNRWIISSSKFERKDGFDGNMVNVATNGKRPGMRHVYEWIPFQRRHLF